MDTKVKPLEIFIIRSIFPQCNGANILLFKIVLPSTVKIFTKIQIIRWQSGIYPTPNLLPPKIF